MFDTLIEIESSIMRLTMLSHKKITSQEEKQESEKEDDLDLGQIEVRFQNIEKEKRERNDENKMNKKMLNR